MARPFLGSTLFDLLHFRVGAGVANPVECALAAAAGSERTWWLSSHDVAASPCLGWCEGGANSVRSMTGEEPDNLTGSDLAGVAAPGQRVRLIHRETRLPWQLASVFPSLPEAALREAVGVGSAVASTWSPGADPHGHREGITAVDPPLASSDGEVDATFIEQLVSGGGGVFARDDPEKRPELVFLDVDSVLAADFGWWHQSAPFGLPRQLPPRGGQPHAPFHRQAPDLRGMWTEPALIANLCSSHIDGHRDAVANDPRFPVTLHSWRERLLREDGAGLGVVERLAELQRERPRLRFVMTTTHVNWADTAAFRDVLLHPLRVVGCVWPRHLGGILRWIEAHVAPHSDHVSIGILDDRADFYTSEIANTNMEKGPDDAVSKIATDAVANALIHVPRRLTHRFTRTKSGPRFLPLSDGELPLVQKPQVKQLRRNLDRCRPTDTAALRESLF